MLGCSSTCIVYLLPVIALIALVLYLSIDWLFRRPRVSGGPTNRWVLITGCDTGFGNAAAKRLDSIGCRVIAGCLTAEGKAELRQQCSSRLVPVLMDITSEESVQTAFKSISDLIGPGEALWGLVNNAGALGSLGPVEWLSQEDFSKIFELNVLGMVRVIRIFLPLMKRSSSGCRIVNTSSILGKISIPYSAPYCMSKHAVEAFSDALRVELVPYNMRVSIVEPGGHQTKFLDGIRGSVTNSWNRLSKQSQQFFGTKYLEQVIFLGAKVIPFIGSSSLDGVVSAYEHALFSCRPRRRYLVGRDALVLSVASLVPSAVIDFALSLPGLRAVPSGCVLSK